MSTYPKYKRSGIAWLGDIPESWSIRKIFGLFTENTKKNQSFTYRNAMQFNYGKLIDKNEVFDTNEVRDIYSKYTVIKKNDIAINGLNLNYDLVSQRIALSPKEGIITSAYIVISPREGICPEYYCYLFKGMDSKKMFHGMGTGIRLTLAFKELRNQKLPLPPLLEQEAIVRYLDAETAKIDKAIAAEEKMIALLQERRQGVLRAPWGAAESAPCKTWGKRRIKTMASKIGSGKTPKGGANVYSGNGILFIRSQNVYNEGLYLEEDVAHISAAIDDDMKGTRVCRGDLLLNITGGSIGRCCIYDRDEPANVNQHVCIIRIIESIANARFVQYFINAYACDIVGINQTGGNREGLNFQSIGNITIPLPPLPEQERIVKYLDAETGKIDRAIEVKRRQIALLRERREIVINEAVTGRVSLAERGPAKPERGSAKPRGPAKPVLQGALCVPKGGA